jgi:mannitol-1-phosphate/altronate dehydrogenase
VLPTDGPDLAKVGVILTDDVRGFERAKLRLLNGVHSTLAYAGILRGHETVFEAVSDPVLEALAREMMTKDIIPTLTAPRGLDLANTPRPSWPASATPRSATTWRRSPGTERRSCPSASSAP